MALVVKNPLVIAGDVKRHGFDPWVRKIPWRKKWQPAPVFLPGESHGQRSLAGYSHGIRKSCTEWLTLELREVESLTIRAASESAAQIWTWAVFSAGRLLCTRAHGDGRRTGFTVRSLQVSLEDGGAVEGPEPGPGWCRPAQSSNYMSSQFRMNE